MKVRPGRERSLLAGVIALVVMVVGLVMMGGLGGRPGWFTFLWVLVGLGGAAASFYNAFSRRGLPLYGLSTRLIWRKTRVSAPNVAGPLGRETASVGIAVLPSGEKGILAILWGRHVGQIGNLIHIPRPIEKILKTDTQQGN